MSASFYSTSPNGGRCSRRRFTTSRKSTTCCAARAACRARHRNADSSWLRRGQLRVAPQAQFTLTLTDLSEGMLAQSRALNPEAEHIAGDMRTLRLNRAVRLRAGPRRGVLHDDARRFTRGDCRPLRRIAGPAAP